MNASRRRRPGTSALSKRNPWPRLAVRYFRSRGPATVKDCADWSGLTMADVRLGLALALEDDPGGTRATLTTEFYVAGTGTISARRNRRLPEPPDIRGSTWSSATTNTSWGTRSPAITSAARRRYFHSATLPCMWFC